MIANYHNTYDLKAVIAGALLLLTSFNVLAKSLGVVGEVFPIAEMSFLALIESRMANLSKNLDACSLDFFLRYKINKNKKGKIMVEII